jgi:hypothetical protein
VSKADPRCITQHHLFSLSIEASRRDSSKEVEAASTSASNSAEA